MVPRVTLIVAPLAVLAQWKTEIQLHCEADLLRVHIHHGNHKLKTVEAFHRYDVVLCTYQAVLHSFPHQLECRLNPGMTPREERRWWSQRGILHRIIFWRVVLDESQLVKNPQGQISLACQALEAVNTWALSGTPIQNRLEDIFPVIRFLRHPLYGAVKDWRTLMGPAFEHDDIGKAMNVSQILKGFVLRRTKNDTLLGDKLITLPEKRVVMLKIRLLPYQQRAYTLFVAAGLAAVNKFVLDGSVKANVVGVLAMILRLRQVCNHPYLTRKSISHS